MAWAAVSSFFDVSPACLALGLGLVLEGTCLLLSLKGYVLLNPTEFYFSLHDCCLDRCFGGPDQLGVVIIKLKSNISVILSVEFEMSVNRNIKSIHMISVLSLRLKVFVSCRLCSVLMCFSNVTCCV